MHHCYTYMYIYYWQQSSDRKICEVLEYVGTELGHLPTGTCPSIRCHLVSLLLHIDLSGLLVHYCFPHCCVSINMIASCIAWPSNLIHGSFHGTGVLRVRYCLLVITSGEKNCRPLAIRKYNYSKYFYFKL